MLLEKIDATNPLSLTRDEQARKLAKEMQRTTSPCCEEMHIGVFFDGTNNNKDRDAPRNAQSNVGRLFDAFAIPVRNKTRYKFYCAGVGTPFERETSDTGRGYDSRAGLGAGWGGEARINWALLQISNALHSYCFGRDLSDALGATDRDFVRMMSTDVNMADRLLRSAGQTEVEQLRNAGTLGTSGYILDTAAMAPNHSGRRAVLKQRRDYLRSKLAPMLASRKPTLKKIRLSVFGFSRGAAAARVFCNWLSDALDKDMKIVGIPVELDFLGIFDTVASVGFAQSFLLFEGHGGWAQEQYLRIPSYVKRTVHLVSAHEVRGSFPLDKAEAENCLELVYPGVHSDLGGGYVPGEQGKGCDEKGAPEDSCKLSQIPLARMYREAVAAGVPLDINASSMAPEAKQAFKVSSSLARAYNDYVDVANKVVSLQGGGTTGAVKAQYGMYLRWRKLRLPGTPEALENQPFFKRAEKFSRQDAEDLRSANRELQAEAAALPTMEKTSGLIDGWMRRTGLAWTPVAAGPVLMGQLYQQVAGEKVKQWREVKSIWNHKEPLDSRVVRFFDDHVHDSRAWFKPLGATSEDVWKLQQKERMERLKKQHEDFQQLMRDLTRDPHGTVKRYTPTHEGGGGEVAPLPLTGEQLAQLEAYKNGQLPTETEGREWSSIWGYLRWRTHYEPERTLGEKVMAIWGEATSLPERAIDKAKDAVTDLESAMKKKAAELLGTGIGKGTDYLQRQAADALRRLLGNGIPTF